ncbi:MAG: chromate transporter, partial [Lachnospiraceae bacterium]|nr:chromate transporter [Lachnospiraceae bacterium]
YGAIPLIRDVVMSYGWVSEEMFAYFVAVSESTPGPIMVNLATYVGSTCGGFFGAALATGAVVFPSFGVILLIIVILKKILDKPYVQACLSGIKASMIGIIFATGLLMLIKNVLPQISKEEINVDITAFIIMVILLLNSWIYKKRQQKAMSPIVLILTAAVLGVILY